MTAMTGDRLRNNLTGTMYRVKVIKGKLVVLESEDGSCRMLTEKDSIKLFYEKIENVKRQKQCFFN
jgi:hypothetical protein